jgi:hypothetical protein
MLNVKERKSSGPDGIIKELFKYSSDATIKALAKLFNLILKTGQVLSMNRLSDVL